MRHDDDGGHKTDRPPPTKVEVALRLLLPHHVVLRRVATFILSWGGGGGGPQHQQQWGGPPPGGYNHGGGGSGFFSGWGGGGGGPQHQQQQWGGGGGGGYGQQQHYPPQHGGYDDDGAQQAPGVGNNPWGPFANIRLTPTTIAKLFASLLIDAIGFATYAVPVLGEAGDAVWAPISGFLIFLLYGNIWLAGAGFVEELMPGLDFIPTATLAWVADNTGLLRAGQQFGFLRNLFSMFGGGGGNAAR